MATLLLGLGFLGLALSLRLAYAIWRQVAAIAADLSSSYLKMFYAMTGLHAVHVIGGLIPLAIITIAAFQGMYGPKKNAAIRYTAVYWHFLDAVWCTLIFVSSCILAVVKPARKQVRTGPRNWVARP